MKKALKVIIGILAGICCLFVLAALINFGCNLGLRNYIKSFEPVDYSEGHLVPVKEEGHYTFKTDDDFKIMQLTDVHIGGGFWTYKKDKKSIYEVITMLQKEKPDLVILGGDNTFAVPGPLFNGGFTMNNKMVATTVIDIFEHEKVYFSTVLGNHDTESFDLYDRQDIGNLYLNDKFKYCIFEEEFTDPDADTIPSVSNQCIAIKKNDGTLTKLIVLLDTNAYVDTSLKASLDWQYDTIHQSQIDWAASVIREYSEKEGLPEGEYVKTLVYMHIPVGEYQNAYDELFKDTFDEDGKLVNAERIESSENTEYIDGSWDEDRVFYGGISNKDVSPEDQDLLFETLSMDMNSAEAFFCGHDHVNNATVKYKGIYLCYGYSVDNIAYTGISNVGSQRGATVVTVSPDKTFAISHNNAYSYYGCDPNKFINVDTNSTLWPEKQRAY